MSRGALYIWPHRRLVYAPQGLMNAPHAHPALSCIVALEGSFQLEMKDDQSRTLQACLLAPRCHHRLDAQGVPLVVLHLEHSDPRYHAVLAVLQQHRLLIPDATQITSLRTLALQVQQLLAGCRSAHHLTQQLCGFLAASDAPALVRDPRIHKCLRLIENRLPDSVSVADLAFAVDLSPTRLMHVFKREMGMPVRRFVLWARLRAAVNALQDHGSLTDAAHAMGFADSAHLSRTFSQMFGIPPSQVLSHDRFVQAHFCDDPVHL